MKELRKKNLFDLLFLASKNAFLGLLSSSPAIEVLLFTNGGTEIYNKCCWILLRLLWQSSL